MSRWRPRVALPGGAQQVLALHGNEPDNVPSQIVKYIPGETILAYQGVVGIVGDAPSATQQTALYWAVIGGLVFTFLWNLGGAEDRSKDEPLTRTQAIGAHVALAI